MAYDPNNVFARIVRGELPAHRVYEDSQTLAFMDLMPQADGHTLVIPKHAGEGLLDTPPESLAAAITTVQRVADAVSRAFAPQGIVLTQFNGSAAGQTVFHLHFHIIPVYAGGSMLTHARTPAPQAQLVEHAERIRAALAQS
jgi:histidine triad (HIT) family protein